MPEENNEILDYWDRVPKALRRKYGLAVSNVYALLLDVCPRGSTTVKVRQKWLAQECLVSVDTIQRALKKLEKLKLIKRTRNSRASTYEIRPIIPLKGAYKDNQPETIPEDETGSSKFRRRKKDKPISPEKKAGLDKYLSLSSVFEVEVES